MKRPRLITETLFAFLALIPTGALAAHPAPEAAQPVPCGILERFEGVVQILDSGRSKVVDVSRKVPISCGGSLSVGKGWAQVRHRDGHRFYLSSDSFIELPFAESMSQSGDHVTLFRGELYAQVEQGSGEFRVLTANARARTEQGTMVVIFNRQDEETQLVSLERSSSLENRFEPTRKTVARPGEATTLNFKLLRVTPSDPRAISVAALKAKLAQFQIPEAEYNFAVRMAHKRLGRKFATTLVENVRSPASENDKPVSGSENLPDEADSASLAKQHEAQQAAERAKAYARHTPVAETAQEQRLQRKWRRHLSAGESAAENLLYPNAAKAAGAHGRAPASASDSLNSEPDPAEEKEKRRLIEELSRIREEE